MKLFYVLLFSCIFVHVIATDAVPTSTEVSSTTAAAGLQSLGFSIPQLLQLMPTIQFLLETGIEILKNIQIYVKDTQAIYGSLVPFFLPVYHSIFKLLILLTGALKTLKTFSL